LNLAHLLKRQARMDPLRPAILNGTQLAATHGQWAQRCQQLARQFQAAGLQPGDRIALFMRNHVRYLEVLFGAWWAGLAVVPINAKLHVREAQWIIDNAQARWAFVTADITSDSGENLTGLERVIDVDSAPSDALWQGPDSPVDTPITERTADDLAWLFYTSGTTGRPKGVMITHRNLMTMGLAYFNDVDAVGAQDTIAYAASVIDVLVQLGRDANGRRGITQIADSKSLL
jgi:long-chain acyl-CoA synthetase